MKRKSRKDPTLERDFPAVFDRPWAFRQIDASDVCEALDIAVMCIERGFVQGCGSISGFGARMNGNARSTHPQFRPVAWSGWGAVDYGCKDDVSTIAATMTAIQKARPDVWAEHSGFTEWCDDPRRTEGEVIRVFVDTIQHEKKGE